FRWLPDRQYASVLGFGSAYGSEFRPIAHRIERLVIVDPSDTFVRSDVFGIPVAYVKPTVEGVLPFRDNAFDLITCLGVLHHIPNVSCVLQELYRCLQPGGYALIREPVISMGDWTRPRPGLTKRERGIPLPLFREMIDQTGYWVMRESACMFPLSRKFWSLTGISPYSSRLGTIFDQVLSKLTQWNLRYHATSFWGKLRPSDVFFVLTKRKQ
ncbi:MAG: methyltransferase domain-containing protein, partial [Chloroflexota bacterium]|nr:methyltransferase domain-containing protein [Chloroflexota bacterium]